MAIDIRELKEAFVDNVQTAVNEAIKYNYGRYKSFTEFKKCLAISLNVTDRMIDNYFNKSKEALPDIAKLYVICDELGFDLQDE